MKSKILILLILTSSLLSPSITLSNPATLSLDPPHGPQGAKVTASGSGFGALEGISLSLYTLANEFVCNIKTVSTDSEGSFSTTFPIPAVMDGLYNVAAEGADSHLSASTRLKIGMILVILTPDEAPNGAYILYTGVGFTPEDHYRLSFDGDTIASGQVEADSTIYGNFNVPQKDTGTYTVECVDVFTGITLDMDFTVTGTTSLHVDPSDAVQGETVMIRGENFVSYPMSHPLYPAALSFEIFNADHDNTIEVKDGFMQGSEPVTVNQDGDFTGWWSVPMEGLSPGMYTIRAVDEAGYTAETQVKIWGREDWWPHFQGDAAHTGYSPYSAPNVCNIKWCFDFYQHYDEAVTFTMESITVAGGKVFVPTWKGILCLDAQTGNLIWDYRPTGDIKTQTVYEYNRLFLTYYEGSSSVRTVCLSAETGEELWRYPEEGTVYADFNNRVTVGYGRVYTGVTEGLVCLDAFTGDYLWTCITAMDDGPWGMRYYPPMDNPSLEYGRVYFQSQWESSVTLYCVDAYSGAILWTNNVPQYSSWGGHTTSTVSDGKIYLNSAGELYSFNAFNGEPLDSMYTGQSYCSSPATAYGNIYVGSVDHDNEANLDCMSIRCLDSGTLEEEWLQRFYPGGGFWINSAPAVADGKIYLGTSEYTFYCFAAYSGNIMWGIRTPNWADCSPAIAYGNVYFSSGGKVYAFASDIEPGDYDGDGIADDIDSDPFDSTLNNFSDLHVTGKTYGWVEYGDQILFIYDAPLPEGVVVKADPSGGTQPATIHINDPETGTHQFTLNAGDEVILTAGSINIEVVHGPVEAKLAHQDMYIQATVPTGNSLYYDTQTNTLTAPAENTEPITILIDGAVYILEPGTITTLRSLPQLLDELEEKIMNLPAEAYKLPKTWQTKRDILLQHLAKLRSYEEVGKIHQSKMRLEILATQISNHIEASHTVELFDLLEEIRSRLA